MSFIELVHPSPPIRYCDWWCSCFFLRIMPYSLLEGTTPDRSAWELKPHIFGPRPKTKTDMKLQKLMPDLKLYVWFMLQSLLWGHFWSWTPADTHSLISSFSSLACILPTPFTCWNCLSALASGTQHKTSRFLSLSFPTFSLSSHHGKIRFHDDSYHVVLSIAQRRVQTFKLAFGSKLTPFLESGF